MIKTAIRPIRGKAAVIGGGMFGCRAAMALSDMGLSVTIFEKNNRLMQGASFFNQCRAHIGYHYPRSAATAQYARAYQEQFETEYKDAMSPRFGFNHYYAIEKHSKTSPAKYKQFCNIMGLSLSEQWPCEFELSKRNIAACYKVKERLFDPYALQYAVMMQIRARSNIRIDNGHKVTGISLRRNSWRVNDDMFNVVVNATYGNINDILGMAGLDRIKYQYDLCELPIIDKPWKLLSGIGIMDGPYFGVIPFGFRSGHYSIWDVDLSVIDSAIDDKNPFEAARLSPGNNFECRFENCYKHKIIDYIPSFINAELLGMVRIVKAVPAHKNRDDARPTELLDHGQGFYSLFAGKICAALPAAAALTEKVRGYLCHE